MSRGPTIPLPTLLSHVLVALTIECDNEFEYRMPHRTTRHASSTGSPWLVSLVMWFNCMQFLPGDGIPLRELERRARTTTNLAGMERWRYITLQPDPSELRPKPPRRDWIIKPTALGKAAQQIWRPLIGEIEQHWETRYSKAAINSLRSSLVAITRRFSVDLPDCLPILGYGLFSSDVAMIEAKESHPQTPLAVLLSKVLLAFALDYEKDAAPGTPRNISLAIGANILRVLDAEGVPVRKLPALSGVSKEAVNMAAGYLQKHQQIVMEADPSAPRTKLIRLTEAGMEAKLVHHERIESIEKSWETRFGPDAIQTLRAPLEALVGDVTLASSPLFEALKTYRDNWRASLPKPQTLPHYPMVLHRGGYPDGS